MKEVLKALVNRISRKAVILAIAMTLVYMIVVTPNPTLPLIAIGAIVGIAIFGAVIQFYLDLKNIKKKEDKDT